MEVKKIEKNLKTAKGQIEGILKMLDESRDCFDVSNQLLATISILKNVNAEILTSHLSVCVNDVNGEKTQEKTAEIIQIIKKLSK